MNFSEIWGTGLLNYYFGHSETSTGLGFVLTILGVIICIVSGYLLGSINLSIEISARRYKDDIRRHGSGNAGMTNVMRTYGKRMAGLTFAGDFLKAVIASLVGRLVFGYYGAMLAGLFCFIGHIFPIYYKFKGGKGVVTACAMVMMTNPDVCLILLAIFILLVLVTKYVSLGSVVALLFYPIVLERTHGAGIPVIIALVMGLMCAFAHRENIKRIYNGNENKLTFKKKSADTEEESE